MKKKTNPNPSENITKTGTQLQQIVTLIKKKLEQLLSRRNQKKIMDNEKKKHFKWNKHKKQK